MILAVCKKCRMPICKRYRSDRKWKLYQIPSNEDINCAHFPKEGTIDPPNREF